MICCVRNDLRQIPGIWWSLLLEQKEQFGEKGEYHRYFLTKEAYQELINLQNQGVLRFQRQALVLRGTLHYLPAHAFFRDRE